MTELRFVLTVDDKRRLHLPEGVPFEPGEPVHLLWDGKVLQVARTKPKIPKTKTKVSRMLSD